MPDKVERALVQIRDRFRALLEPQAVGILDEARSGVRVSYALYERSLRGGSDDACATSWGYEISPERPLAFRAQTIERLQLQADLFCRTQWTTPGELPCEQQLVLRVWSLDDRVIFRKDLDCEDVKGRLGNPPRRVMVRYHFDLANPDQHGPRYHLQVGGKPRPNELCWLHEGVAVPRIPYPPMDLVLACELVAANFCLSDKHTDVRRVLNDPNWLGVLRDSQKHLLVTYYNECVSALANNVSLLRCLCGGEQRW